MWNLANPNWEKQLLAGQPLVPQLPLFDEPAEKALRIFKRLRLPDVTGTPTMGEAADEWLFAIVRALFGSLDPVTKRRMVQELFLLVPKKNSKSSGAAAIMVTALIMNERPLAEFLLVAPTKEIADISFKQASGIITLDPELKKLFQIQRHIRLITHHRTKAMLQIKAASTDAITGSKSTGILVDETHEFATKSNAADVFLEVRGALAARPDGFMIQITTQSKSPPAGVFRAELQTARDVRDGKIALPMLAVLYELPERLLVNDGWKDESTWPLVNPNLGRSVSLDFLRTSLVAAENKGPTDVALLASQHFNVEIGARLRGDRWPGAEFWEKRADPTIVELEDLIARCEVVVMGIDGGGLDDLLGVNATGREIGTGRWLSWSHAYAHPSVLDRRPKIAPTLRDFEARGELTIVTDALEDIDGVIEIALTIKDAGKLGGVGADPAGLGDLVEAFKEIGITPENGLIGVPQGIALMNAIKTTERKLVSRRLLHCGSTLMVWCVTNLKIEPTATAIRATKQNAGDAKIDGAMAQFNAVFLMIDDPQPLEFGGSVDDFLEDPLVFKAA
jgi:phage terminase large subunit-like protein